MIIDSHQHFWNYNPAKDVWIDDSMEAIKRSFLPKDLQPILAANKIGGCIAIQADQSENETEFLLKCAEDNSFIKGVVGWVDLCANNIEERLSFFSKNKLFKGVRHIVQSESENFMLRSDFQNGISKLEKFNLTYDILVFPNQLPAAITLVNKFPNQMFIIDHIAKPFIKSGKIQYWKNDIIELSKAPNVFCKLSGLVTEADLNNWNFQDFTPYLDVVFKAFGVDRLVYGSDWPVCLLAAKYEEQLHIIKTYTSKLSLKEKEKIMGENAIRFYGLKQERQ